MINPYIKPRLARLESGAFVECKRTDYRGFVVEDGVGTGIYRVAIYCENGGMIVRHDTYSQYDVGSFFIDYKVIAHRDEYQGWLEGKHVNY